MLNNITAVRSPLRTSRYSLMIRRLLPPLVVLALLLTATPASASTGLGTAVHNLYAAQRVALTITPIITNPTTILDLLPTRTIEVSGSAVLLVATNPSCGQPQTVLSATEEYVSGHLYVRVTRCSSPGTSTFHTVTSPWLRLGRSPAIVPSFAKLSVLARSSPLTYLFSPASSATHVSGALTTYYPGPMRSSCSVTTSAARITGYVDANNSVTVSYPRGRQSLIVAPAGARTSSLSAVAAWLSQPVSALSPNALAALITFLND